MKKYFFYIGIALFFAALIAVMYNNSYQSFDGRITLRTKDKIPYGAYTAYEMLKKEFPRSRLDISKNAPWEWEKVKSDSPGQALIIVAHYFDPTEDDLDYLTGFAQKGNTVLISALRMSGTACRFFHVEQPAPETQANLSPNQKLLVTDSLAVRLDSQVFEGPVDFKYPGASYESRFTAFDQKFTYALGYNNDSVANLLAIDAQKGKIILQSAPVTFTNFFLLYGNNYQYYRKLLSLVPQDTKQIYWDEYFLYNGSGRRKEKAKGLLSVIFQYPAFEYAFWGTLILLGIYLFTEVKRRQRMVEPYPEKVNESLNFVSTISNLYYDKGDHHNLAEKLTYLFLDHVRTRYKIPTNELNSGFEQALSLKSSVPLEEIETLVAAVKHIQFERTVTGQQLMDYNMLLENFYKKA
jgi:hypothetical protein